MAAPAPVILYEQGGRQFMVTSFPMVYIADRVKIDDLKKGADPDTHYNRPLIPEHYRAIATYLVEQPDYILPSITLCIEDELTVHVPKTSSSIKTGIAVLPQSISFIVTDGQHRIRGIQEAIKNSDRLKDDAIAVTIVNEREIEKVHQDFVDCAQTKAISPALLTAFNVRDPLARLVREIASNTLVFRDRIEKVGTTVGKNSIKVFTMNQLRAGVAELLIGNSVVGQTALRKSAAERLKDEDTTQYHQTRISEFYRKFAAYNNEWTQLVLSAEDPAYDRIDTHDLRSRFVHFTATGLVIIGRVGHQILQQDETKQDELIRMLAELDWSRHAPLWQNNIVTAGGKVTTQNTPVTTAVLTAKLAIGLSLTIDEQAKLERMKEQEGQYERELAPAGTH
jgi:DGQHR domain-containing protein